MDEIQKTKASPLTHYYRQPKIYIELPSKGKYYPDGALDHSDNGQYAVYAMTAKDELMYKTPDALMSGKSTVEVIQSCIPSIKDAWQMPSLDVDACLIGIRIATYGEGMDVNARCPACNEENEYTLNLVQFLSNLSAFEYNPIVSVGELTFNLRPYTYKELTKKGIENLEYEKIFNIVNSNELSDEDKINLFGESFVKLTQVTIDVVADVIASIDSPMGSESNPDEIRAFVRNAPKEIFDAITNHLNSIKEKLDLKLNAVTCEHCGHEYNVNISMDQADFFAARS